MAELKLNKDGMTKEPLEALWEKYDQLRDEREKTCAMRKQLIQEVKDKFRSKLVKVDQSIRKIEIAARALMTKRQFQMKRGQVNDERRLRKKKEKEEALQKKREARRLKKEQKERDLAAKKQKSLNNKENNNKEEVKNGNDKV